MVNTFKVKIIFAYYVTNEFSNLHKWHLINFNNMLLNNLDNDYFNDINFYLLVDDINNEELINKTKNDIASYIDNHFIIYFHIIQNNPIYREGLIYKNEIIDKLDQYDDNQLILFLHSKGISNKLNIDNYFNTLHWIACMYFFNFEYFDIAYDKFINGDIITYGTLYNYDDSSLTKYKWQYTGSFHYIYPHRFLQYIKDKNINYEDIKNNKANNFIRFCAEAFVGDYIEPKYAGFCNDYLFNKTCSHFLYENSFLPYSNILYVLSDVMHPYYYEGYLNYFENTYNDYKHEITNDL